MNLQKYQELAAAKERQILERGLQRGLRRGLRRGKEEGLNLAWEADRRLIETLLAHRFGRLDPALQKLIPSLLDLPPEELGTILATLPREAPLARFPASD